MTDKQKEVLRKIIYAVETGGQVYGQADYAAFTWPYTNSSIEHAITIGAGQWYGEEARELLQVIEATGEVPFPDALVEDMKDPWDAYDADKDQEKEKDIIRIITTPAGKQIQDIFMDEQLREYVQEAEALGVTSPRAQAMCANFRHQGGYGAMKRVIGKTNPPYSLDSLYEATLTDTGNQVGAYRTRQKFVYYALKTYMEEDEMKTNPVESAVSWMINLANDSSHGYDQIYRWGERGDFDCSSAVITAYQEAGIPVKTAGATYTGNMKRAFMKCGFSDVTDRIDLSSGAGLQRGDVLLNEVHHTAMYIGDGLEVEASINERGTATGGQPGDQTDREILIRSYRNYPWDCVLRCTTISSDKAETPASREKVPITLEEIRKGDSCQSVWVLRTILRGRSYKTKAGKLLGRSKVFDTNTDYCVRQFQEKNNLEVDGIVGKNTWSKLTGIKTCLPG